MSRRFEGARPPPCFGFSDGFRPPAHRMPFSGSMYRPPLQYIPQPHSLPRYRPPLQRHVSNYYLPNHHLNYPTSHTWSPRSPSHPPSSCQQIPSTFPCKNIDFCSEPPVSTSSTSPSPSPQPITSISPASATIVSTSIALSSSQCTLSSEPVPSSSIPPALPASIPELITSQITLPSETVVSSSVPHAPPSLAPEFSSPQITPSEPFPSSSTPPAVPSSKPSQMSLFSEEVSDASNIKKRLRSGSSSNTPITDIVSLSSESDEADGPAEKMKATNVRKKVKNKQNSKINSKSKHPTNWREKGITPTPTQPPKRNIVYRVSPEASKSISNLTNSSLAFSRVMHHNSDLDEKMVNKVLSLIRQLGTVHWDDVCGLSSVKQRLKEMVVYPLLNPALFQGLRRPGRGLLLFGPPGNGKTLIGKCLASEARATFFSVTASSFGSKWYGEAETLAKTLFECARALQPSIIFIDEVDSILRSAQENDGGCSTRLRTELLACMDGCTTSGKDEVLVVGATNWPGKIDEAARRRFTRRMYVPLPDKETRTEQFQRELRNEKHDINEEQFHIMADMTEGYSGADLAQVCRNAAMKPIRSLDLNCLSIEFVEMKDVRPINLDDFLESINETSKSVSAEMIKQLEKFNEMYSSL